MNKQNKQRYQELYLSEQRKNYPAMPDFARPPADCKENGANSLTKLVCSFINLSGGQAERISTTGRMIDNTKISTDVMGGRRTIGSMEYIPGTGTKGSADISSTIHGRSVKIEIKWAKDRQSQHQKSYENAITRAGGIYYICRTFDDFIEWYDNLIFKINQQTKLF